MNDEITNVAADSKAPDFERTGASPEAIISHYDKGEDFFELVLGPELIYSCALFEGDDDFAAILHTGLARLIQERMTVAGPRDAAQTPAE